MKEPSIPLGHLERVPVRRAFPGEAADFSPWLAQPANIRLLAEALGLDLDPEATEYPVGDFRADLVARAGDGETIVLIEESIRPNRS